MSPDPLVVHYVDSTVFGGAEQAMITLFEGLAHEPFEIVLAHHRTSEPLEVVQRAHELGITTLSITPLTPGLSGLVGLMRFAPQLQRLRPALLHAHLTWPLGCQYAIAAAKLARIPKTVATLQLTFELALSRRVAVQQLLLTRAVDRYLAVSEQARAQVVRELGWPAKKIDVVHNAVWPRLASSPSHSLRASIVSRPSTPLVLVPARLHPQKGHRYLLHAVDRVPNAHFVFAGDGPEREYLSNLASVLGVAQRVTFLGHRDDMQELLAIADLVVLPSLYEGLPISVLEAMGAGKPVVATRIGGTDEIITDGHDGLLVPPGDSQALADGIRSSLKNHRLRCELGKHARATVETRFSADRMCARVSQVYEELIND
jgi:glycosyltransferase involved in cell wall biosynthesis